MTTDEKIKELEKRIEMLHTVKHSTKMIEIYKSNLKLPCISGKFRDRQRWKIELHQNNIDILTNKLNSYDSN